MGKCNMRLVGMLSSLRYNVAFTHARAVRTTVYRQLRVLHFRGDVEHYVEGYLFTAGENGAHHREVSV